MISRAWSRTDRTPSITAPGSASACSRARSRSSRTGSQAADVRARSSARSWSSILAVRLRWLSRSARARRHLSSSSATFVPESSRTSSLAPCSGHWPVSGPPAGCRADASSPGSRGQLRGSPGAGPAVPPAGPRCSAGAPSRGPSAAGRPWCHPWPSSRMSLISGELRVDHIFVGTAARGPPAWRRPAGTSGGAWSAGTCRARCGDGTEAGVDLLEFGGQGADPIDRGLFLDRLAGVVDEHLRPRPLVFGNRVPQLSQTSFDLVGDRVELVAGVDGLPYPGVLVAVGLGVADHPLDLGLVQ